jgi:hypothetical protein
MYSGIARLTIVSERKKTFQFVGHAQEIFVHTFPLLVLTMQNSNAEEIGYGSLARGAVAFSIISIVLTSFEVCLL